MPQTHIFGFGSTVVQRISFDTPEGRIFGVALVDVGEEHEVGTIPDVLEQTALGIKDNTIATADLDTILWFRTEAQAAATYNVLTGKF